MKFPEIIKGVWSFGNDSEPVEIPIEDIECFKLWHKSDQNGLVVTAHIKKSLVSFYSGYHPDADEYGLVERKYRDITGVVFIRGKDMPKFRPKIKRALQLTELKKERVGINAGTPIARSVEKRWKEIRVGGDEQ